MSIDNNHVQSYTETTDVVDLADEQLEDVSGGVLATLAGAAGIVIGAGVMDKAATDNGLAPEGQVFEKVIGEVGHYMNPFNWFR